MMLLATNCMARTVINQAKVNDDLQRSMTMALHVCDPSCFDLYCYRRGNPDCRNYFDDCILNCRFNDYFCFDSCAADCGC